MKTYLRISTHILAGIFFYLAFSYALFLGLQVSVAQGSIAVVVASALFASYMWFVREKPPGSKK